MRVCIATRGLFAGLRRHVRLGSLATGGAQARQPCQDPPLRLGGMSYSWRIILMTVCLRGNESGSFFYYSTGLKCACGKTQLKDEATQCLF